jgi:hypothetical protein
VRTISVWPASSVVPPAAASASPSSSAIGWSVPPVDQACGHQQALLSREDPARGVLVAPSDGEHGCPVGAAKLIRQPSLVGSDGQLDGAGDRLVHHGRGDLGGVGRVDPGTA